MMTHYEIFLDAYIKGFDILLCILVYTRHVQRRLPFFTIYATTILITSFATTFVYIHYGFRTAISYEAVSITTAATLLARSFAIAELCRDTLGAYRGIWALAWRLLGLMAVGFLVHAAIDAQGQPHWLVSYRLTIERDIEISSAAVIIAMLIVGSYYRLPVQSLTKWLVGGMCLYSVIQFVNTTVFRDFAVRIATMAQVNQMNDLWNTVYIGASSVCIGMWCFALRKPLAEPAREPVLLPAEFYQQLSPEINLQLRSFNDRLLELLKS